MNVNYILRDTTSRRTYNGFTNNTSRRLRQHNGELVGGARATRMRPAGAWEFVAILSAKEADGSPVSKRRALSIEWSVRYPTNRRPRPREFATPEGRIRSLALVLSNPKFRGLEWEVRVHPEFRELAASLLSCPVGNLGVE